jgi:hypothetical protein
MPTVVQLRAELQRLGLDTKGLKAVLEARLAEHQQPPDDGDDGDDGDGGGGGNEQQDAEERAAGRRSGIRSPSSSPPPQARRGQPAPDDPVLLDRDFDDNDLEPSREGRILFATLAGAGSSPAGSPWWRRPLLALLGLGALLIVLSTACGSRRAFCAQLGASPSGRVSGLLCGQPAEAGCGQVHGARRFCAGVLDSVGASLVAAGGGGGASAPGAGATAGATAGREYTGHEVSRAELRTEILELRSQFTSELHAAAQKTLEDCTLTAAQERTEDAASRVVLTERVQAAEAELAQLKQLLQEKAAAGDVAAQLAGKADSEAVAELLAEKAAATALEALSATVAGKADTTEVTALLAGKVDAAELGALSSATGENADSHAEQLTSLAAEVAQAKSQLAEGPSRDEYSSLSAAVAETKGGLGEAVRSIADVREALTTAHEELKREHGESLVGLEASQAAQQSLPEELKTVSDAQAELQSRVTALKEGHDALQVGAEALSGEASAVKGTVDEVASRLSAIEAEMDEGVVEGKIR